MLHAAYENPLNFLGEVAAFATENTAEFRRSCEGDRRGFVEEMLQIISPLRKVARWAAEDSPLGLPAKRGDAVWIDLHSANHDTSKFPPGDYAPVDTRSAHHLAFGRGTHVCPGQEITRLLFDTFVDAVADVPEDVLATCVVERHEGLVHRGATSVVCSAPDAASTSSTTCPN